VGGHPDGSRHHLFAEPDVGRSGGVAGCHVLHRLLSMPPGRVRPENHRLRNDRISCTVVSYYSWDVKVVVAVLAQQPHSIQREFFIDNLSVIIEMIWCPGLAPWEFKFPFPGSLTSTFLVCKCSHMLVLHLGSLGFGLRKVQEGCLWWKYERSMAQRFGFRKVQEGCLWRKYGRSTAQRSETPRRVTHVHSTSTLLFWSHPSIQLSINARAIAAGSERASSLGALEQGGCSLMPALSLTLSSLDS